MIPHERGLSEQKRLATIFDLLQGLHTQRLKLSQQASLLSAVKKRYKAHTKVSRYTNHGNDIKEWYSILLGVNVPSIIKKMSLGLYRRANPNLL